MENLQSIKQRYGIIGHSPLLDRALNTAVRVASTDLSTLYSDMRKVLLQALLAIERGILKLMMVVLFF